MISIWFTANATVTPSFLASLKSRMVYLSGAGLRCRDIRSKVMGGHVINVESHGKNY